MSKHKNDNLVTCYLTILFSNDNLIVWQGCYIGGVSIPTTTFSNLTDEKKNRIIDAAVNELSIASFEHIKLSNIIKEAKIPRGSFYQYFEDKMDLYKYVMLKIGEKKVEYLSDKMKNDQNLPFLDLFRELYISGIRFAVENPKYIRITELLLSSKGQVYDELMGRNLSLAFDYFKAYILKDIELGLISSDVDVDTLCELVIDITTNITNRQLRETGEIDMGAMLHKVDSIITIFKKGITGEQHV